MALMNVKVILQVAYMSAFRPYFCLNGSFAKFLVTDRLVWCPDPSTNNITACANACAREGKKRTLGTGIFGAT